MHCTSRLASSYKAIISSCYHSLVIIAYKTYNLPRFNQPLPVSRWTAAARASDDEPAGPNPSAAVLLDANDGVRHDQQATDDDHGGRRHRSRIGGQ